MSDSILSASANNSATGSWELVEELSNSRTTNLTTDSIGSPATFFGKYPYFRVEFYLTESYISESYNAALSVTNGSSRDDRENMLNRGSPLEAGTYIPFPQIIVTHGNVNSIPFCFLYFDSSSERQTVYITDTMSVSFGIKQGTTPCPGTAGALTVKIYAMK